MVNALEPCQIISGLILIQLVSSQHKGLRLQLMNFTLKRSSLLDTCSSLEHKAQGRGQKRIRHPRATSL